MQTILIIGGGIGGMTLAAALSRLGVVANVYEQAPQIGEVGAGVAIWPNARASLAQIGAAEALAKSCSPMHKTQILSRKGRVLSAIDLAREWPDDAGAYVQVAHRAALLSAIQAQVPPDRVHTGERLTELSVTERGVVAHFEGGGTARGTALIGADGIRSVVRKYVVGEDALRYSGQTCFRGIAPIGLREPDVMREIHGIAERGGVVPISERMVYWFVAYNAPAGEAVDPTERKAALLRRYAGWPAQLDEVIAATPAEQILHNDLYDRVPVRTWSRGPVALLGDAAHPTTPNLGQGANMAIDDAIVLARALAEGPEPQAAFQRYQAARLARTTQIVERSALFGRMCLWRSPLLVRLRELLMRLTPRRALRAEMQRLGFERVPPLTDEG